VAVAGITLSHADRVLWPDLGITKLALARYCEAVAQWMLPHVAGRPLTLVRCPDGIAGGCFFMKHSRVWSPAGLRRVKIPEKHKTGEYLIADNATALVALVQMNVVEVHTWNSTIDDLERPDRLVFDLDPGGEVGWHEVVAAARTLRTALDALELPSFVKTTGGHGLHIVVPLRPQADWQTCLAFAHRLADGLAAADPTRFTTNFTKRGRERKILIDYLRNNRTNTSVAAYSPRARPGATVSMPLTWNELRPDTPPDRHTLGTALQRLRRLRADPWADYAAAAVRLGDAMQRLAPDDRAADRRRSLRPP
jgi:bifunctional non-homologous end joining protein LigD